MANERRIKAVRIRASIDLKNFYLGGKTRNQSLADVCSQKATKMFSF